MKGGLYFILHFILVIGLFGVLFAFAMFQGGFFSWFLFYAFLPVFLYQCLFLFYPIRYWKVKRIFSQDSITAGGHATVTIQLKRKLPFPLFYCVAEEIFPDSLNRMDDERNKFQYMDDGEGLRVDRNVKRVIFPLFKRKLEIPYTLESVPRGRHELKRFRLRVGDLFGMVHKEVMLFSEDKLIAYPSQLPIRLTLQDNYKGVGDAGVSSKNMTSSNIASGIREYVPGDRFSWIDWKQTAKNNTMMTKEFEQEKSTNTLLILNSIYDEGLNHVAFEAAIEVAISLFSTLQKRNIQTKFHVTGGGGVTFRLNERESVKHYMTDLKPVQGNFGMEIQKEMFQMETPEMVLLVTSHLDASFQLAISSFRERGIKRIIIVFIYPKRQLMDKKKIIKELQAEGVLVVHLNEKQLVESPLEVNIS